MANWTKKKIDKWIPFQSSGIEAAWFNPMTGETGKAITKKQDDGVSAVYVQLKPGETLILQWYSSDIDLEDYPVWQTSPTTKELHKQWTVSFVTGGPVLPASYKPTDLKSWTVQSEEHAKFSGTATYSTRFELEADSPDLLLDLGKVHESAIIKLNGTELGTLLGPTFQIILPSDLLKIENLLEIQVTNLMANRIIDMDKNGINYKKFYNINFAAHERENRGPDGNFSAANWDALPSGLLGPVTFTEIAAKDLN